jgi:hypothetical protein
MTFSYLCLHGKFEYFNRNNVRWIKFWGMFGDIPLFAHNVVHQSCFRIALLPGTMFAIALIQSVA